MEYASKTEAINGADNTKIMTPLRVKQSIIANSQGGGGGIINETDPVFTNSPAYNITQNDINNWNNNTGGITNETDPIFSQSPAFIITQDDIERWNSFSTGSNASKLILEPLLPSIVMFSINAVEIASALFFIITSTLFSFCMVIL